MEKSPVSDSSEMQDLKLLEDKSDKPENLIENLVSPDYDEGY